MSRGVRDKSEVMREMWRRHFSQIELTETRFYEKYDSAVLAECFEIAAGNLNSGRQLRAFDEENLSKYIMGIIRRRSKRQEVKQTRRGVLLTTEFWFHSDYAITQADRERFEERLERSGDCLVYRGRSTTGGYQRFWVNGRSILAHRFAYFVPLGHLPAPGDFGGPQGLQVAHRCGDRCCCNPLHLRLTTRAVNLTERVFGAKPVDANRNRDYGSTYGTVSSTDIPSNPEVSQGQQCEGPLSNAVVLQGLVNRELNDSPSSCLPNSPSDITEQFLRRFLRLKHRK